MLTSKQRANLRGKASVMDDVCFVGKDGITNALLDSVRDVLTARELIKIKVLPACELSAREVADSLSASFNAEVVGVIGTKVIIYKKSEKKNIKHIVIN